MAQNGLPDPFGRIIGTPFFYGFKKIWTKKTQGLKNRVFLGLNAERALRTALVGGELR